MYNLLISLACAALAFALGALAGQLTYGIAPAILVFPVVYFLLARRTGLQLEVIMKEASAALQARDVEAGKALMRSALPLGKWQFLVSQQINAQLGALEYVQRNYDAARPLLEKSWSRNWQASSLLAILDVKAGQADEAVERLEKARILARKETLYWGISAWVLLEAKRADEALRWLAEGLETLPDSAALSELRSAIANDKLKRFRWDRAFGQGWYQFFPEQVPGNAGVRQQIAKAGYQRGGKTYPAPRGGGGRR